MPDVPPEQLAEVTEAITHLDHFQVRVCVQRVPEVWLIRKRCSLTDPHAPSSRAHPLRRATATTCTSSRGSCAARSTTRPSPATCSCGCTTAR